jgi:hypothetical protein
MLISNAHACVLCLLHTRFLEFMKQVVKTGKRCPIFVVSPLCATSINAEASLFNWVRPCFNFLIVYFFRNRCTSPFLCYPGHFGCIGFGWFQVGRVFKRVETFCHHHMELIHLRPLVIVATLSDDSFFLSRQIQENTTIINVKRYALDFFIIVFKNGTNKINKISILFTFSVFTLIKETHKFLSRS